MPAAMSQGLSRFPSSHRNGRRRRRRDQRRRAEPTHAGCDRHHRAQLTQKQGVVFKTEKRDAGGEERLLDPPPARDAQPAAVEKGAGAAFGGVQLVVNGRVDDARERLAVALQRDRDGEVRNAVQEVRRAVERIDDPAVGGIAAGDRAVSSISRPNAGRALLNSARSVCSARLSALLTKSAGPSSRPAGFPARRSRGSTPSPPSARRWSSRSGAASGAALAGRGPQSLARST